VSFNGVGDELRKPDHFSTLLLLTPAKSESTVQCEVDRRGGNMLGSFELMPLLQFSLLIAFDLDCDSGAQLVLDRVEGMILGTIEGASLLLIVVCGSKSSSKEIRNRVISSENTSSGSISVVLFLLKVRKFGSTSFLGLIGSFLGRRRGDTFTGTFEDPSSLFVVFSCSDCGG
jgi:hypothetical protein